MNEITKDKRFENFSVEFHYSKNGSNFVVIKNIIDENSKVMIKPVILQNILNSYNHFLNNSKEKILCINCEKKLEKTTNSLNQ